MAFISMKDLPSKELLPGFEGKFIHTENMSLGYWSIKAGSILPEHAHVHEQVTHVLEGKLEMTIGNITAVVEPGKVSVIPSGVKHSGRAITDCIALDVFQPVREDYKARMEDE